MLAHELAHSSRAISTHENFKDMLDIWLCLDTLGGELQRVVEIVPYDAAHCSIERGGKQEHLPFARHLVKNALHTRQETHVGHSVSLVNYHHSYVSQVDVSTLHQVFETSRGGHDD